MADFRKSNPTSAEALASPRGRSNNTGYDIQRVGVLGAGTMGARIAAHVANAGLPVLLLDRAGVEGERNGLALNALEGLKKAKPAAFADAAAAARIRVGNFEDDLARLKDCDWVIEAVAEDLEIKRALLARVVEHLSANALLTTNTSGLPVAEIAEGLPEDVRRRWLGTHFFNPPRYMRLLEMIATAETDPRAVAAIRRFGEQRLGKTVVPANDVPNFIANRIGTFSMLNVFRLMKEQGLSIEEVDALTGAAIGWPKTGTFRLTDMVGIDVLWSVARNFEKNASDERGDVMLPAVIEELVKRKWLGDKTGQGFYRKARGADGKETRLTLDLETFEYKPAARPQLAELEMVKANESAAGRIRSLLAADPVRSRVARFYWSALPELWTYAANRIGEVAASVVEIDRAMKAGFNWELGPFEMWDAAGIEASVAKMRELGLAVPAAADALLAAGATGWYRNDGTEYFDVATGAYKAVERSAGTAYVADFKRANGVFAGNSSISLVDLGDGVACFEFHSKMNSLGEEMVSFLRRALEPGSEAVREFEAFVIANDAANFSVGANLMQLLLAIQDEEWDEVVFAMKSFQAMTQAIKFCARPVVVAAAGMCFGGGTEVALHAALRQPHLELYAGLVETSVGLIPGGGGCKEMLLRALAAADAVRSDSRGESVEVHQTVKSAFETIAMAKVSASAAEAHSLRLLGARDRITMNRDRLLTDAKQQALRLAVSGYTAPAPRADIAAPGETVEANLKLGIYMMREGGFISEHDAKVARHVAHVLAGGDVRAGTLISEDRLLELEREAFLSLCGEAKTMERIGSTLKTGKPLRN